MDDDDSIRLGREPRRQPTSAGGAANDHWAAGVVLRRLTLKPVREHRGKHPLRPWPVPKTLATLTCRSTSWPETMCRTLYGRDPILEFK